MHVIIAMLAVLISTTASAVPIKYGFDNYVLEDGGSVQGYFVFDKALASSGGGVSTVALIDYSILVSGGDTVTFPATTYTLSNSTQAVFDRDDGPGGSLVYAFGLDNADNLELRWTTTQDLPNNLGESVALTTWGDLPFGLTNQQCYDCFPQRLGVSGSVVVQAISKVSEPSTFSVFVLALMACAYWGFHGAGHGRMPRTVRGVRFGRFPRGW